MIENISMDDKEKDELIDGLVGKYESSRKNMKKSLNSAVLEAQHEIGEAFGTRTVKVNLIQSEIEKKFELFLEVYKERGAVSESCKAVGLTYPQLNQLVNSRENFRKRYDEATEIAFDKIEQEAYRRAVDGVKKTIYYKGEAIGEETVYSDRLLEALLRGFRRKNYGTSQVEVSGRDGGAIEVSSAREALAAKLGVTIDNTTQQVVEG